MASFEASLKDLQVQYLDLFLIHWPLPFPGADWKPLVTESWKALERLYDEGAVRAIGLQFPAAAPPARSENRQYRPHD